MFYTAITGHQPTAAHSSSGFKVGYNAIKLVSKYVEKLYCLHVTVYALRLTTQNKDIWAKGRVCVMSFVQPYSAHRGGTTICFHCTLC